VALKLQFQQAKTRVATKLSALLVTLIQLARHG
jgi:hypothetical protein